jgi:hypothetical protein
MPEPITVKQLIAKLSEYEPDATVIVADHHPNTGTHVELISNFVCGNGSGVQLETLPFTRHADRG